MDKKRGLLNVSISIGFKIIILFFALLNRRVLINYIGNDANGLNSLYTSLIGFLTVTELGVGTAISYCMYKPIVENNTKQVTALYNLFKKIYRIVGIVIFILGISLIPFLPKFASDYSSININMNLTFFLTLLATVITYLYGAKSSLIIAYKNNYIITTIKSLTDVLRDIFQILIVIYTKSFVLYLVIKILTTAVSGIIISRVANRKYYVIVNGNEKLDDETKKQVKLNIKSVFINKFGSMLVNASDNVIISAFIGIITLGHYSNYTLIASNLSDLVKLFFIPLISVIGHTCAKENRVKVKEYFNFFYGLNYVIGTIAFLGYYAIINDIISIIFSNSLIMSKNIAAVITINYFIQYLCQTTRTFKEATGLFFYERFIPLIEGVVNIVLSIVLVKVIPQEYAVVGVIIATIITNLLISHLIGSIIIYKHYFNESSRSFILSNYVNIAIFCLCLYVLDRLMIVNDNNWYSLIINGIISVGISVVVLIITIITNRDFKQHAMKLINQIIRKKKRDRNE